MSIELKHNPFERCIEGMHYASQAPDTLDLAERMALALNALTRAWMRVDALELPLVVDFSRKPAVSVLNHAMDAYLNIPPKFLEGMLLCRLATGSGERMDVDLEALKLQLRMIGDDGLAYCPPDTLANIPETKPYAESWAEGRMLIVLSLLAQLDDDPIWLELGKKKIDRLMELSLEKQGFRYLWKERYYPGDVPPAGADEVGDQAVRDSYVANITFEKSLFPKYYTIGALGCGAGLFYRVSGYENAFKLSEGLARWAMKRVFPNEDGDYAPEHFHHGLMALLAVCQYGIAAKDRVVLERVNACFQRAIQMGDSMTGFYPEFMPGSKIYLERQGNTTEICEVADMLLLALYLSREGIADYWDEIDRWTRNVFAEGQLTDADFLRRIPADWFSPTPRQDVYQDDEDIIERSIGSFLGWMRFNEGLDVEHTADGPRLSDHSIMHCCTGNGSRLLFYLWDAMLETAGKQVRLNMLLNRTSELVDVHSYIPVEGKLVFRFKGAQTALIRMPQWCEADDMRVEINGSPVAVESEGRYIRLVYLKSGDEAVVQFPLSERTVFRVIGEKPYKLKMRGTNIVDVSPKGSACLLYEKQPSGTIQTRLCFVPDAKSLIW